MPETRADTVRCSQTWQSPAFEVIALDCEITAYAPDGGEDRPLL